MTMTNIINMLPLLTALEKTNCYPHPVGKCQIIETSLSWVILAGKYAYKIKKPLDLGYADFSTLEKRKYYCALEITLNKRLAPQLYLGIVPITGTMSHPKVGGVGEAIEYAIQMQAFEQDALLRNFIKANPLTQRTMQQLAQEISEFHRKAEVTPSTTPYGSPQNIWGPMQDNIDTLRKLSVSNIYQDTLDQLESWSHQAYLDHERCLQLRKSTGFIRACHGDLHLGNIVLLNKKPTLFDGIEFNENFRWIDTISDIGFLAMDLEHHDLAPMASYLLDQYCAQTNDYAGIALLNFYKCYRALVRAKVAALQITQHPDKNAYLEKDLGALIALAHTYTQTRQPTLTLTHGVSGSGKSVYTETLLMKTGAIRLRSDAIRKHLFQGARYSKKTTEAVYSTLYTLAEVLLAAGHSVIIDATFLTQAQRAPFFQLAEKQGTPITLLSFDAPTEILIERIRERLVRKKDISEADETVLIKQLALKEPLTEQELAVTQAINTEN